MQRYFLEYLIHQREMVEIVKEESTLYCIIWNIKK